MSDSRHVHLYSQRKPCNCTRCHKCGARTPEPKLEHRRLCPYCKKEFNRTFLYEHMRFHCRKILIASSEPIRKINVRSARKWSMPKVFRAMRKHIRGRRKRRRNFYSVQMFNRSSRIRQWNDLSACVCKRCVGVSAYAKVASEFCACAHSHAGTRRYVHCHIAL